MFERGTGETSDISFVEYLDQLIEPCVLAILERNQQRLLKEL